MFPFSFSSDAEATGNTPGDTGSWIITATSHPQTELGPLLQNLTFQSCSQPVLKVSIGLKLAKTWSCRQPDLKLSIGGS